MSYFEYFCFKLLSSSFVVNTHTESRDIQLYIHKEKTETLNMKKSRKNGIIAKFVRW